MKLSTPTYPWLTLANILISTWLAVFSAMSVLIADGPIQKELSMNHPQASWIITLYLIAMNGSILISPKIEERIGTKKGYIYSLLIFLFGSLLCGISWDFPSIATGRVLQGVGAGIMIPMGLGMIATLFSSSLLPIALTLYAAISFGGGLCLGPFLSGLFSQFYSWRLSFFLPLPLGIGALIAYWVWGISTPPSQTHRFDMKGFFFLITTLASLLIALTYAPLPSTNQGWSSPFVLFFLFLSLISFSFTVFLKKSSPHPVLSFSLFQNPLFALSSVALFLLGTSIFSSLSLSINYMTDVLSYDLFQTGKLSMFYGLSLALFSVIANVSLRFIRPFFLIAGGLGILSYSYFDNDILSWQTGPSSILEILILRGIGGGLTLAPVMILGLSSVSPSQKNEASMLLTFCRQVGGSYGGALLALLTIRRTLFHLARFSSQISSSLPSYQLTSYRMTSDPLFETLLHSTSDQTVLKQIIGNHLAKQALVSAQTDAFFIFGFLFLFLTLLLTLFYFLPCKKKHPS